MDGLVIGIGAHLSQYYWNVDLNDSFILRAGCLAMGIMLKIVKKLLVG